MTDLLPCDCRYCLSQAQERIAARLSESLSAAYGLGPLSLCPLGWLWLGALVGQWMLAVCMTMK